ncbi:hypothetical protein BGW38_007969, partial [Lunasporangiospora selenospora]
LTTFERIITAADTTMTVSSFLRLKSFDPVNAVTSYFYGPKVLLITRLFGSIYILAVLIGALATTP